ncbi:MAG: DUF3267 domain-containing protein [Ignavibacteriaceae bacterium]
METESVRKRDVSISFWRANLYAIIFVLPIFVILYFLYLFIWEKPIISFKYPYWLIYVIGVIIHELIHGIFAMKFSKQGMKSVKFGISWKSLTPYCHCKEPLTVRDYRIVLLSPLFILGIISVIIGLLIGHSAIYGFGLLFVLAAGGDLIIFWKLRKENKKTFVLDSADKCGCVIYESEASMEE